MLIFPSAYNVNEVNLVQQFYVFEIFVQYFSLNVPGPADPI